MCEECRGVRDMLLEIFDFAVFSGRKAYFTHNPQITDKYQIVHGESNSPSCPATTQLQDSKITKITTFWQIEVSYRYRL